MVLQEQIVFIATILTTFFTCIALTKLASHFFPSFTLLQHFDAATNFMDLTVILAFAVGLICSASVLFWMESGKSSKPVLDPTTWKKFKLIEKKQLSPNTAFYRFDLGNKKAILGLPIGQHISVQAEINGKMVMRSYTPTSSDDDKGHFDLVVKAYEQGNISKYFDQLKVGDLVSIKGPKGQMKYSPNLVRHLGMIAGGTGLTPCLQVIQAALKNPQDKTQIDFIYANVNEDDILLRNKLDLLAAQNKDRFRIHYFLNNPPQGWNGGVGFVSKEAIEKHLPKSADDIKILMCGPPPMLTAMKKHLAELGYPASRTVSKMDDQVFCF